MRAIMPGVGKGRQNAQRIHGAHGDEDFQQGGEIGGAGAQHGGNVVVDEGLQEQDDDNVGNGAHENEADPPG